MLQLLSRLCKHRFIVIAFFAEQLLQTLPHGLRAQKILIFQSLQLSFQRLSCLPADRKLSPGKQTVFLPLLPFPAKILRHSGKCTDHLILWLLSWPFGLQSSLTLKGTLALQFPQLFPLQLQPFLRLTNSSKLLIQSGKQQADHTDPFVKSRTLKLFIHP